MALEFKIELSGNFQGALEKSNKTLGETSKHAHEAEKSLEGFETELGHLGGGLLKINFDALKEGGSFFKFDLAHGAEMAVEAIKKVAEAVVDLGKEFLQAAADAEDLNLAIELDVGKEGADKVEELAESFGNSAFSPKQIKEALLPILEESGNEHQDQWNDLATAATDVATRRNTGVAGAKAALEALNEIELNPQRLRGSLKSLGIKQLDFYKDLGDLLGISEKAAEAQTKAGKVKAQTLLSVALHQIAQREGGVLGNATNEGDETLGASLKRLANLKDTLFERAAGADGVKTFQKALDKLVDTINGPLGDKAVRALDHLIGSVGSFIDRHADSAFEKLSSAMDFLSSAIDGNNETWNRWVRTWDAVSNVLEKALRPFLFIRDTMLSILSATIDADAALFNWISEFIDADSWVTRFRMIKDAWVGFVYDMTIGLGSAIYNGVVDGFDRALEWVKGKAHIGGGPKSNLLPAGQGVLKADVPALADGGIVSRPTLALVGEAGPEAIVPLGGVANLANGGGNQISYAPVFHVSSREEAESMEARGRVEFKKMLDEIGVAVGA